MQRVAQPILDRAIGGGQRLAYDLPAKDAGRCLTPLPGAAKQIDLAPFDGQKVQQGLVCVILALLPLTSTRRVPAP